MLLEALNAITLRSCSGSSEEEGREEESILERRDI